MTPTECLYVRTINGLDEERTVYAHLTESYDEGGECWEIAPNYVLDDHGRSVPESELPPELWATVIAHACNVRICRQVCFINL